MPQYAVDIKLADEQTRETLRAAGFQVVGGPRRNALAT